MRGDSPNDSSGNGDSQQYINGQEIQGEVKKAGLNRLYAITKDGQRWSKRGNTPWAKAEHAPQLFAPDPVSLAVVREHQVDKVNHWLLFVGREGDPGAVYQVKGDNTAMQYSEENGVNIVASTTFRDYHSITHGLSESQQIRVAQIARNIVPPSAANLREVKENCQDWVIKVLWQLHGEGFVPQSDRIRYVESLKDKIT